MNGTPLTLPECMEEAGKKKKSISSNAEFHNSKGEERHQTTPEENVFLLCIFNKIILNLMELVQMEITDNKGHHSLWREREESGPSKSPTNGSIHSNATAGD